MKCNYIDGELVKQDLIIRNNKKFLLTTYFSNDSHQYIITVLTEKQNFILDSYTTSTDEKEGYHEWYNFFAQQPVMGIRIFLENIE